MRGFGHIYTPPGNNALELYVAALSAAPDNGIIAAELEDVLDQTFGMIEKALLEQRTDDAAEALQLVRRETGPARGRRDGGSAPYGHGSSHRSD